MDELSHWDFCHQFELDEAALLIVGLDGHLLHDDDFMLPQKAMLVAGAMESSFLHGAWAYISYLNAPEVAKRPRPSGYLKSLDFLLHESVFDEDQDCEKFANWLNNEGTDMHFTKFTHGSISQWLAANNYPSAYKFREGEFSAKLIESSVVKNRQAVSNKLASLTQAATRFWANADPNDTSTHPENITVATWLAQQGFSETLAAKGATIIRPEWAFSGRKPDTL